MDVILEQASCNASTQTTEPTTVNSSSQCNLTLSKEQSSENLRRRLMSKLQKEKEENKNLKKVIRKYQSKAYRQMITMQELTKSYTPAQAQRILKNEVRHYEKEDVTRALILN